MINYLNQGGEDGIENVESTEMQKVMNDEIVDEQILSILSSTKCCMFILILTVVETNM